MNTWLLVIQILLGIGLISTILMQARGVGLGRSFGGAGLAYHSKRGIEQLVYRLTIVFAVLFFVNSILVVAI